MCSCSWFFSSCCCWRGKFMWFSEAIEALLLFSKDFKMKLISSARRSSSCWRSSRFTSFYLSWASFSEMKNTECSESPDELFAICVFMRVRLSSFSSNWRAFVSKSASRTLICSTRRLTSVSLASTNSLLSRYSCHLAKTFSFDARSSCSCLLTSASRSSRLSIFCN